MYRTVLVILYWVALGVALLAVWLPWLDPAYRTAMSTGVRFMWGVPIVLAVILAAGLCIAGPVEWLYDESRHGVRARVVMASFGIFIFVCAFIWKNQYPAIVTLGHRTMIHDGFAFAMFAGLFLTALGLAIDWAGDDELDEAVDMKKDVASHEPVPLIATPSLLNIPPQSLAQETTPAPAIIRPAGLDPIDPANLSSLSYAEFAARRAMHLSSVAEQEIVELLHRRLQLMQEALGSGVLSAAHYDARIQGLRDAIFRQTIVDSAQHAANADSGTRNSRWRRLRIIKWVPGRRVSTPRTT